MVLWTMAAAAADQSLINKKAPDFSLRDQHDRPFTRQTFSGRPLILMACDKKASKQNGPWRTAILGKYADRVQTAGVADLRTAPFFMSGFIKKDFKKDPVSILLDWEGALFTSYGLAQKVPNIIVIDGAGFVRYLYSGTATPEAEELLFTAVEDILKSQ
jgi:predicted transcriptional regulator